MQRQSCMATVLSKMTSPLQLQSFNRHPSPPTFPRRRGLAYESRPNLPEVVNVHAKALVTLALFVLPGKALRLSKDALSSKDTYTSTTRDTTAPIARDTIQERIYSRSTVRNVLGPMVALYETTYGQNPKSRILPVDSALLTTTQARSLPNISTTTSNLLDNSLLGTLTMSFGAYYLR